MQYLVYTLVSFDPTRHDSAPIAKQDADKFKSYKNILTFQAEHQKTSK